MDRRTKPKHEPWMGYFFYWVVGRGRRLHLVAEAGTGVVKLNRVPCPYTLVRSWCGENPRGSQVVTDTWHGLRYNKKRICRGCMRMLKTRLAEKKK